MKATLSLKGPQTLRILCRARPCISLVLLFGAFVTFLPAVLATSENNHHHRHHPDSTVVQHASFVANAYDHPSDILAKRSAPPFLTGVTLVATVNILLNYLRPDPGVAWQLRFPRIAWELCILATVTRVNNTTQPSMYLMISLILGTTALLDIFLWAPLFSLWAGLDNQDCTGGWFTGRPRICRPNYIKGYGRLLVTVQCMLGGLFYLSSAISAWAQYHVHRDQRKANEHTMMFQEWMKHQQRQPTKRVNS